MNLNLFMIQVPLDKVYSTSITDGQLKLFSYRVDVVTDLKISLIDRLLRNGEEETLSVGHSELYLSNTNNINPDDAKTYQYKFANSRNLKEAYLNNVAPGVYYLAILGKSNVACDLIIYKTNQV